MKFLIIRLSSLGDIVLTTPVIKAVKERYPDAVVDFLVKKEYHDLLSANPHLNRVITLDSKGMHKGLTGLLEISKELRVGGYTHVIDLHGNLRSRMITSLLPGAKTLRYDKQAIKRRLLLSGFKANIRHTVDAYLEALEPLVECGTRNAECGFPKFYISKEDQDRVDLFLSKTGIPGSETIIGISPGAKWQTKRWMEDGFIEVGRRSVKELGAKVIVFGGPDEIELCERVAAGIGKEALSVAGKVGLKETAALINRCKVFVSNDSGPMHIATAVGTPVVAIFGPTVQGFGFSPLGKGVVVEKELECRPCSLHGSKACPRRHFECMNNVTVDDVMEAIRKIYFKDEG